MRKDTAIGIVLILALLITIVAFESTFPEDISISEYRRVDILDVKNNPSGFEGDLITFFTIIESEMPQVNGTFLLESDNGLVFLYNESMITYGLNRSFSIRGLSLIASVGHIVIHEVYPFDDLSSEIRSIPGLILFVIGFFIVFQVDFRNLTIRPRRR